MCRRSLYQKMCFHSSLSLQSWTLRESATQDETSLIIRQDFKGRENNFSMAAIMRGVMRLKWQHFAFAVSSFVPIVLAVHAVCQMSRKRLALGSTVVCCESKYDIKHLDSNWSEDCAGKGHFLFPPQLSEIFSWFWAQWWFDECTAEAFCLYLGDTLHSNDRAGLQKWECHNGQ